MIVYETASVGKRAATDARFASASLRFRFVLGRLLPSARIRQDGSVSRSGRGETVVDENGRRHNH